MSPFKPVEERRIFYTADRSAWRAWLSAHYKRENEIWFVFPTASADEPALSYNDAVEEALCFGWIDSTAGRLDDTHGLRRFTPRRVGSSYSRPNIERLIALERRGMISPDVLPGVIDLIRTPYSFPEDILDALRADTQVWQNYLRFSEPYRRIRVAYIDAARGRPDEFRKRLESFIAKTRQNKLIRGYGGIDRYYGNPDDPESSHEASV